MELTRRDAAATLAALGAAGGVGLAAREFGGEAGKDSEEEPAEAAFARRSMVALAEVLYPAAVSGVEEFVEAYLDGRLDGSGHGTGVRMTVAELEDRAGEWYDTSIPEMARADRDSLLREVGADTAEADPSGTTAERVRYYVVNELLLGLYASPTGGELLGLENPQGHPGGTGSYTHGPG